MIHAAVPCSSHSRLLSVSPRPSIGEFDAEWAEKAAAKVLEQCGSRPLNIARETRLCEFVQVCLAARTLEWHTPPIKERVELSIVWLMTRHQHKAFKERGRHAARVVSCIANVVTHRQQVGLGLLHLLCGDDAGRVEELDFGVYADPRKAPRHARAIFRLGLLLPDQTVDERRLAHVGITQDGCTNRPWVDAAALPLLVDSLPRAQDGTLQLRNAIALPGVDKEWRRTTFCLQRIVPFGGGLLSTRSKNRKESMVA